MGWLGDRKERARGQRLWEQLSAARNHIVEMGFTELDELLPMLRERPSDATPAEWVQLHDSAEQLVVALSTPLRLEMQFGGETAVTEYVPLTGEVRESGGFAPYVEQHDRYFDGPFTACQR